MKKMQLDFEQVTGPVKPMHGVNNAPVISYHDFSLLPRMREAGIPYCRLHDCGGPFGGGHFVDVQNIFPDMAADEENPASYDFALTDALLAQLDRVQVKPFYRLGASIENGHRIKAYHIFPPADDLKWAKICANIVRHYNEGWANGYHYGIEYWEIWNEPDNEEQIADNPMWKGTKERFFAHYQVVAGYLKRTFPNIKVGGYASCGFYAIKEGAQQIAAANSSPRMEYFVRFFQEFLAYIAAPETKAPLDFFSWHSYASIEDSVQHARYVRRELDRHGFVNTESILNEWNPDYTERTQAFHAAKIAGMMLAMQEEPMDQMEFYTGDLSGYGSLFHPMDYSVTREFYVFKAFDRLYQLGGAVKTGQMDAGMYALAATDGRKRAVMMANVSEETRQIRLDGGPHAAVTAHWIDATRLWSEESGMCAADAVTIPPAAVVLLEWDCDSGEQNG